MTPKEKAMQLFFDMRKAEIGYIQHHGSHIKIEYHHDSILVSNCAKKHALIAVDEILQVIEDNSLEYDDNFWDKVKTEIQKL